MKIALAGNPNSGKTTLFNLLTGSNQYVGNWAGVTVEKKEGRFNNHTIVDLPGIYSLSPYSPEEIIAQKFIINEKPDVILNIIDGTNLERNLYLTLQLIETGVPVVCGLNMIDILRKRGDKLDTKSLSLLLGVPVVEISALKNTGIDKLIYALNSVKENKVIHKYESKVEKVLNEIGSDRFKAVKIFQGDNSGNSISDFLIKECEAYYKDTRDSIIINQRYELIEKILSKCYKKSNRKTITDVLDLILMGKYTAFPVFIMIMTAVFYISFFLFGNIASDLMEKIIGIVNVQIQNLLGLVNCSKWLISLITDGIISGVGSVLAFLPELAVLFFFLSFLEDSGYMSRVAFLMDRVFRKFGLTGKSIIPLILGTGCSVPAIMATKTIENRKSLLITTSFIPCSAKLPVILLIGDLYFNGVWYFVPLMYLAGFTAVLISSLIISEKDNNTYLMEISPYHLPKLSILLKHSFNRVKGFLIKAGTILVIVCTVMWILSNTYVNDKTILNIICEKMAFLFAPLGFGNVEAVSAVLAGLFAKENIVASLSILGNDILSPASALSFLMFNLLNTPCVMAVVTMAKEMKSKKDFLFAVFYQNVFAYLVSCIIFQIAK